MGRVRHERSTDCSLDHRSGAVSEALRRRGSRAALVGEVGRSRPLPLRRFAAARGDVRRRHAAAHGVWLAARRPRLQLHAHGRRSPATSACAGKNIFYPMGWDDNGLPTERRVQNYFHVRCDARTRRTSPACARAEAADALEAAAAPVSRPNFIELCHQLTRRTSRPSGAVARGSACRVDWRREVRDHRRPLPQAGAALVPGPARARATRTRSTRRRCGTWISRRPWRRPRSRTGRRPGAFHDIEFGVEGRASAS